MSPNSFLVCFFLFSTKYSMFKGGFHVCSYCILLVCQCTFGLSVVHWSKICCSKNVAKWKYYTRGTYLRASTMTKSHSASYTTAAAKHATYFIITDDIRDHGQWRHYHDGVTTAHDYCWSINHISMWQRRKIKPCGTTNHNYCTSTEQYLQKIACVCDIAFSFALLGRR